MGRRQDLQHDVQTTPGFRQVRAAHMRNILRPIEWFVLP